MAAPWTLRLATIEDIPELDILIPLSVNGLQKDAYSVEQRKAAIGTIFGVDRQLIEDGTYLVAESAGRIVGCGGWSRRKSACGSSAGRKEPDPLIDPATEAPRIRAFFVHPDFARRGIGSAILRACEAALLEAGFRHAEISATLTGEFLYKSMGYKVTDRFDIQLANGLPLPCVKLEKKWVE